MNEDSKLLPLGTVVLLKNGKKKVMITGYLCIASEQKNTVFDYSGCMYPEGMVNSNVALMFNHSDIDKVFYVGYTDFESEEFGKHILELKKEISDKEKES